MNPDLLSANWRRWSAAASTAMVLVVAGCAGSSADSAGDPVARVIDTLGAVPADLEVDVLVERPDRFGDESAATGFGGPGLRALRVTLAPDGSLHAVDEGTITERTVPQRRRTLDRADVAAAWTRLVASGLAGEDTPTTLGARPGRRPVAGPRVTLDVHADGRRWRHLTGGIEGGEAIDPAIEEFVRWMAGLAWADGTETRAVVVPRRYDLGPDPWRRYLDAPGS